MINYFNSLMLYCIVLLNVGMSSRGRFNTNSSRQRNTNVPTEKTTRVNLVIKIFFLHMHIKYSFWKYIKLISTKNYKNCREHRSIDWLMKKKKLLFSCLIMQFPWIIIRLKILRLLVENTWLRNLTKYLTWIKIICLKKKLDE